MTTTIPAGWTIKRTVDDCREPCIDIDPPEGAAHGCRYYSDGATYAERLTYRLASALLSATPAAPQPPAEPARKPLTDAEIENAIEEATRAFHARSHVHSGQQITSYDNKNYWLARAIERAHGIGDDK
jgi:hypothetical protein